VNFPERLIKPKLKKIPENLKHDMFSLQQHGKLLEEHFKNPKTAPIPKRG
jgi:hypothetical protein